MPTSEKTGAPMTVIRHLKGEEFDRKGKRLVREADGSVWKDPDPELVRAGGPGSFRVVRVTTALELRDAVMALEPGEVCLWGAPPAEKGLMHYDPSSSPSEDVFARSSRYFPAFESPSVLCLDCDMPEPPALADYISFLRSEVGFDCDLIGGYSSSAGVFHPETGELVPGGGGGLRVYAIVDDGPSIPGVLQMIVDRGWLRDPPWSRLILAGIAAPERGPADMAMKTPCQADFSSAGALLEGGLVQDRTWTLFPGESRVQGMAKLRGPSAEERREIEKRKFFAEMRLMPEIMLEKDARAEVAAWRKAEEAGLKQGTPDFEEAVADRRIAMRRMIDKAVVTGKLGKDFVLNTQRGDVTVGRLLAAPEKWNGVRALDPMDPGYKGGRNFCSVLLTDRATAFLQVHHGSKPLYVLGDVPGRGGRS